MLLLVAFAATAAAQTVSRVEYYWDTDPGRGHGTPITGWTAANQVNINTTISTAGLSAGIHTLGIRIRSNYGVWSAVGLHRVVVGPQVSRIEYFYDTDPGFGQGRTYATTATGGTVVVNDAQLSAVGVSDGFHRLGLRARAATNGQWSPTYWQQVLVNGKGVVQLEYFYDTVPAYGEGIQYTAFTQGTTVSIDNAQLSAAGVSDGFHRLGIRAKAGGLNGLWSPVYWQQVLVNGAGVVQLEYFYDTVPAYGEGIQYTAFTQGSTVSIDNAQLSAAGVNDGFHRLGIRAKAGGLNGLWSPVYWQQVLVNGAGITQVEYYWDDADPAYGEGTPLTGFTPGSMVTVSAQQLSTAGLGTGVHRLALRARSGNGLWSPTYFHEVFVGQGADYAEYYWDSDPGYGNGTAIAFTPGEEALVDISNIAVPTSDGLHTLAIRARAGQMWSPTYIKTYCNAPTPAFSLLGSDTVCQGEQIIILDESEGTSALTRYRWDMQSDGTADDTTRGDLTYTYAQPGIYELTLGVGNDASCQNTYSKTVVVRSMQSPTVSISRDKNNVCEGTEVRFVATTQRAADYSPVLEWYRNDTLIEGLHTDTIYLSDLRNNDRIRAKVRIYNPCAPADSALSSQLTMRIYALPNVAMHHVRYVFTNENAFTLASRFAATPTGGTYAVNGNTATLFNPSRNSEGLYEISYSYTNNSGCVATVVDTFELRQYVAYTLTAQPDEAQHGTVDGSGTYTIGDTATLLAAGALGWRFSHWNDGDSTNPRRVEMMADTAFTAYWERMCNDTVISDVAEVCDSYQWHGETYTASDTTALHTELSALGCDSTHRLYLTVHHSNAAVETVTTCNSYEWHGTVYTASTATPIYTSTNAAGCDSVTTLHLTVNYSNAAVETLTACDSYEWHGTAYTTSTVTPTYTSTNAAGCDSVTTLHLTVNYSNTAVETVTACNSHEWHGTTYTASTATPTYTGANAKGCDSVTTLHLTVNYSNAAVETVTACNSYVWHGAEYTASTVTPTYTSTNTAGCDSVTTLHLTVIECTVTEITACDSYTWRGTPYTVSGTYINGTDTLVLTINHSTTGIETVTACDSYEWHGTVYTASTATPTYTSANAVGCDSLITLHLTIDSSTTGIETVTACNSYEWHGTTYTASTTEPTYTDINAVGCDSVITLQLTVIECTVTEVTACDSYTWRGTPYTADGTYINGTDTLVLTIIHSTTGIETVTTCDSYVWHGTEYTASTATPTYTTANAVGCDSLTTLHLTIDSSTTGIETVTACNSYVWHGTEYNASTAEPTYTGTNAVGCDSIVTLQLTIEQCSVTEITACDSYTWRGTPYTVDGIYTDGTDTLMLTINHSTTGTETVTACDNYVWHGTEYTASTTTPTYPGVNAMGCDSLTTLHLTIDSSTTSIETVAACNSYEWHGTVYTASTATPTYTDVNAAGCDSVVTLHLTIDQCSVTEITACDSYTWRGTPYTVSGTYIDGTDTLVLTINHSIAEVETVTVCDSYEWHGTEYTASTTTPTYTGATEAGCDSVVTLHLTVNRSVTIATAVTTCDSWQGYTSDTVLTTIATAANGCDSTRTVTLTINHSVATEEAVTACDSWQGYTSDAVLTSTATAANGCDSTHTLTLTINHSVTVTDAVTACDSWQGYTSNTVLSSSGTTVHGCDSTYTLTLTIRHSNAAVETVSACDSYEWHGTVYIASTDVPTYTDTNAAGCDSITTLHLTLNHSVATEEAVTVCDSWQDYTSDTVLTTIATAVNGCDSTHTVTLTVNHSVVAYEIADSVDGEYEWHGEVYTESGTYTWVGSTADGCDSTVTLHLTIGNTGILNIEDDDVSVIVYPNPTSGPLTIDTDDVLVVEVYDVNGRRVMVFKDTNVVNLADLASGSYTLRIRMRQGAAVRRVILR